MGWLELRQAYTHTRVHNKLPTYFRRTRIHEYTTNYPLTSEMSAIDPLRDEKRDPPDANETPVFIVDAADRKLVNEE